HKGTTLRNFNLIKGLAARHEIDLLSFVESAGELSTPSPLHALCRRIDGVLVPRRPLATRARDTLLSAWPDMGLRLWSPVFAGKLQAWLEQEQYNIVQIEGIELARYGQIANRKSQTPALAPKRSADASVANSRLVFDDHNCEYMLQQRAFETDVRQGRRWLGAAYSFIQWQKLRRFEAQVCRAADSVTAVSDADAAALRRLVASLEVTIVPNGIDLGQFSGFNDPASLHTKHPALDLARLALVFVGTMDFRPNVDAVLWFANEVLPRIVEQEAGAHLYVVGARPHQRLDALRAEPAITITGAVDDVRPYVAAAAVYVVPLRIGGGTRFKILEAAAARKAMVSTSLGCEGFPVQDGCELLIADTPAEFAAAVVALLRDPDRRRQLGQVAYALAEAFEWGKIIPRLEAVYAQCQELRKV
ncbi:MAG: glycosyltransferase, partial [Thermoflexales bacterium]|nr:glycosyltransferase [Thermoflexales bacterium]